MGTENQRLMGLDVGRRTIGVALSDLLGLTAQGLEVWRRKSEEDDLDHLETLVDEHSVGEIVVGHPIRTDGSRGPEAVYVEEFAALLRSHLDERYPVVLFDERFTTKGAERALIEAGMRRNRRKAVIDMTAAALLLQTYMERRRKST